MEPIQYVGISELDDDEKAVIDELSSKYYDKIWRGIQDAVSLRVHLKVYDRSEKRRKFSVTTHATTPKGVFRSSSSGWELPKALHESFQDMEKQVENTLRKG